jgi:hypothetical protein
MTEQVRLVGYADTVGESIGFLIPVFDRKGSNALLVQRISSAGVILSFEQVDNLGAKIIYVDPLPVSEGNEAIWAFAFSGDDIISGFATEFRVELVTRVDDPKLANRPLLSLEVAEFLEIREWRLEKVRSALAQLSKIGVKRARAWLDISVLTPDLRRALARFNPSSKAALRRAVATVEDDEICIRGIQLARGNPETLRIEEAAHSVMRDLRSVYPPPAGGWRVRVLRSQEEHLTAMPEAIVWLEHREDWQIQSFIQDDFSWRVDAYRADELEEFRAAAADTPEPLTFAVLRTPHDRMSREIVEIVGRKVTFIEFRPLSRLRPDGPELYKGDSLAPHILVPVPGLPGTRTSPKALGNAVRQVIAGMLAIRDEHPRIRFQGEWLFFRAAGNGPAPAADAWATLYDRVWASGLSARQTFSLVGRKRPSPYDNGDPNWVHEILFPSANAIHDRRADLEMRKGRISAALLLSVEPRTEDDWRKHFEAVEAVLTNRGWRPVGVAHGPRDSVLELASPSTVRFVRTETDSVLGKPSWELADLLSSDILSIDTIAVTCTADPAAILTHLHKRGELLVNMRDISSAYANGGIWSILGSQMRRFNTGPMSRGRSHFMALLIDHAFKHSSVDFPEAGSLVEAIHGPTLGKEVQLSWSRVRQTATETVASVRLLAGIPNQYLQVGTDLIQPFQIMLSSNGVSLFRDSD